MSKVVKAVNSMVSNSSKITNVVASEKELFFLYDKKHKWSIAYFDNVGFLLHYYPSESMSIQDLALIKNWDPIPFVTFKSADIKTREAEESFSELYQIIKNKLYDVDSVLDDIIGDDDTDLPF